MALPPVIDKPKLKRDLSLTVTRDVLYSDAVKHWEADLSTTAKTAVTLRDMTLKQVIKHAEAIGADDSIYKAKVLDTIIRGAEEDENLFRRSALVVPMGDSEKLTVPLFTPDDFAFMPWRQGTRAYNSGGSFFAVNLDCTNDLGLKGVEVGFTQNNVKQMGFDALERALWACGQAAGRHLMQAIVAKYLADVATGMTDTVTNWGGTHYKALVKMESLTAKYGMMTDLILVNPDEGYDVGILDQFIREDYRNAARGIPTDIHSMGSLYGRIPILRHRDVTAASMIGACTQKAMVLGFYHDISIDAWSDPREGMDGSVVYFQYSLKSGKDAQGPSGATSPCAKAWTVCTSA